MDALGRFVDAQCGVYDPALAELRAGVKRGHWMWFVFPQITGLGRSDMARRYAIADAVEARAYLAHPLLGPRLEACAKALLDWRGRKGASQILGPIDAMKLRSAMTLFEAAGGGPQFGAVLDAFFGGERDDATLAILRAPD